MRRFCSATTSGPSAPCLSFAGLTGGLAGSTGGFFGRSGADRLGVGDEGTAVGASFGGGGVDRVDEGSAADGAAAPGPVPAALPHPAASVPVTPSAASQAAARARGFVVGTTDPR